jgi:Bifunctional DNA primase/polymerase, N-terminal/Primase C terminal 1 (PriCT-1)
MSGLFAHAQASYAAHGIATFPVTRDKVPAIRGFGRVGLAGSAMLAQKFADADALGFICGQRSRVTVLDIDTNDEGVLAAALARHGQTPLMMQTGSGNFQAYYRHSGERRRIRPWRGLPIDIIGGGMVIAPPSRVTNGLYLIIQGSLDDLDRLPVARDLADRHGRQGHHNVARTDVVHQGERNDSLGRHCMRNAKACDDFVTLVDVANTFNENCLPPLDEAEVNSIARSAWDYTTRGQNRFCEHGAWFPAAEVSRLLIDQDVLILLAFLRTNNGPSATFMCTNTLGETFKWRRQRLADARHRLIELGYIVMVKQAGYRSPALFKWAAKQRGAQK